MLTPHQKRRKLQWALAALHRAQRLLDESDVQIAVLQALVNRRRAA